MEQKGGKAKLGLSLFGLSLFLLAMPFFLQMGGGRWLLAEALPGQVANGFLSVQGFLPKQETTDESTPVAIWGVKDVEFEGKSVIHSKGEGLGITEEVIAQLRDFSYLKSLYTVDSRTAFIEGDINVDEALAMDFSIKQTTKEPKILIFHTHTSENYSDSDMSKGLDEGIVGVANELERILEEDYGIGVLHHVGVYDVVNGVGQRTGAYERSGPAVEEILKQNPSIEVVIDLHRDGVPDNVRLVTEVDGKDTAQVMFVNGICRLNTNGHAEPVSWLENNYIKENLAFSLQMRTLGEQEYPGLMRKMFLNPYRFILHYAPRSALIEVGAQTNTKEEAKNAMKPLAKILAEVLLEDTP